ncbi:hypothetical protein TNCV_436911 [Trichonephila clavipes]|nr:hypothetical protein TNCV_436911 [Trichonephila clavipes]
MEPQGSIEYGWKTTGLDFQNDQDNMILVFGEESLSLLENRNIFFLDVTFRSSKQFYQTYTIHDLRSKATETSVYPALVVFLPDKRQQITLQSFRKKTVGALSGSRVL